MNAKFKGWKKVQDHPTHAIMRHESGHEIHVAKSALSPKMRGQLAEIPLHKEAVEAPKDKKKAVSSQKGQVAPIANFDNGGKVTMSEQRQSIVDAAKGVERPAKGSSTPQPYEHKDTKLSPTVMKGETAAPKADPEARRAKEDAESTPVDFRKMADGGEVPEQMPELIPGVPLDASNPAQFDFEQKQNEIRKSLAIQNPNLPPEQNEQLSATRALDQIDSEKQAGAQAAAKVGADQGAAYQQAVDLNKRLEANGLPPRPLPPAPGMPSTGQAEGMDQKAAAPQAAAPGINDPYGIQASQDVYMKGINEQKAGIAGEARALGAQGAEEAKVAHDAAVNKQNLLDTYQNEQSSLNAQRQHFMEAYQSQKIDPNHYLGSMNTGERISTAIGLILGGIGGGVLGQENPALKMLNANIDRDIEAQKANLGKQKSLLEFNQQQFGNLRDATQMTKVMMNDIAADKLRAAAAKAMDPLAKARALKEAGLIDQQSSTIIGQYAMRKTMLNGMATGKVAPASVVEFMVPAEARPAARKELKDMQDAIALRDHTLSAFDQIAKLQTLGSRISSPIQSKRQIAAIEGPVLDKLTKDTSGRVTPQTVDLIKDIFGKVGNSPETQMKARESLRNLVSQNMHYPTLEAYHITPDSIGRFNNQGKSNIPTKAPVPNKGK